MTGTGEPIPASADWTNSVDYEAELAVVIGRGGRHTANSGSCAYVSGYPIETLSRAITLLPGDIIVTGTPAGVGIGFDPPRFLKPGDQVSVSITGLGTLENPVA